MNTDFCIKRRGLRHGVMSIEAVLAFLFIIAAFTLVFQFILVANAQQVVSYASYLAVRSACVDTDAEERAVWALTAISPAKSTISPEAWIIGIISFINNLLVFSDIDPNIIETSAYKYAYAKDNTTVDIEHDGNYVIAIVRFKYELFLPVARQVLDGTDGTLDGKLELRSKCAMYDYKEGG